MGLYVMIVEFIGLPASGKSTLAKELFEYRSLKDRKVIYPLNSLYSQSWFQRNLIKFKSVFRYLIINKKESLNILKVLIKSDQKFHIDVYKLWFNWMFINHFYRKYSGNENVVIIDEGFLHTIWNAIVGANNKTVIEEYIEPKHCLLIYVEVNKNELLSRNSIRNVKNNRRYKFNRRHKLILENIDNFNKYINKMICGISNRKDQTKVIRICNDTLDDKNSNIKKINLWIDNYFRK